MQFAHTRTRPLGWNTKLTWVKSGSKSLAMGVPYEIYSKKYGPDMLAIGAINADIILRLTSELQEIVRKGRHSERDHLIRASATAVVGKDVDTQGRARRNYRSTTGRKATLHTRNYRVRRLNQFLEDLHSRLDHFTELPSRPAWLVAIDITIYFREGEEELIHVGGRSKAR